MSWTMLNFPHVVLTFTSTSRAPTGILQNRYPSRSQAAFSDLLDAILKLKFARISMICDSNAGSSSWVFVIPTHSPDCTNIFFALA